jgi:hypothetical protein
LEFYLAEHAKPIGQTGPTMVSRPEVNEWKVVKAKIKGKKKNFKLSFDYLLSKYVNQKTESRNWSSKGSATPSLKHDRSRSHRLGYASNVIKIGSMNVTINDQVDNKILDHGARNKSLASEYMQSKVVPSWLISYSKEEVTVTSKLREQREGTETIEGG